MREHIVSWGGYDNANDNDRVNAKVEASLNLRFAESGTKKAENEHAQNRRCEFYNYVKVC